MRRNLSGGKYGGAGLISGKMEALYAELQERGKAATSSYSATVDFFTIYLFYACGQESSEDPIYNHFYNMVYTCCSLVAERLKRYGLRKLGNIRKVSKLH